MSTHFIVLTVIEHIALEIQSKNLATTESYIGFATDANIVAQTPVDKSTGIDVPGQLWTRFHKGKSALFEYVNADIELEMLYMANPEKGNSSILPVYATN